MKYGLRFYIKQFGYWVERFFKNLMFPKRNVRPVIITGNQKSGTSAIVSLLGLATNKTFIVDVFYRMGLYEEKLIEKNKSFRDFIQDSRCYLNYEIIKEPEFILFLDDLRGIYPDSTIVYIIRDPFENIRSILNRLDISSSEAQKLTSIDTPAVRNSPLWNLLTSSQMPYQGENLFEKLVNRWLFSISEFEKLPEDNVILVKYEDFKENKVEFIHTLATNLGFSIKNDFSSMLNYNFQPKGTSVVKEEFFSKGQIEYINSKCGNEMQKYGYK
jgi:hypothetical protein